MGHLAIIAESFGRLDSATWREFCDASTLRDWEAFVARDLATYNQLTRSEIGGPKPQKPVVASDDESDDDQGVNTAFSKYCELMSGGGFNDDDDDDEAMEGPWDQVPNGMADWIMADGRDDSGEDANFLDGGWTEEPVGELPMDASDDSFVDEADRLRWQGGDGEEEEQSMNSSMTLAQSSLLLPSLHHNDEEEFITTKRDAGILSYADVVRSQPLTEPPSILTGSMFSESCSPPAQFEGNQPALASTA